MHSAGFVHRDISNGNVLCRSDITLLTVKLNDLEYSKCIQPDPLHSSESSDVKTVRNFVSNTSSFRFIYFAGHTILYANRS